MTTLLEPNRDQLEIFVQAIFRHAKEGFVSLRAFYEGADKVFRVSTVRVLDGNLKFLVDVAEDDARRAAQNPKPVVFCPPLATFRAEKGAAEQDLVEGLALSVECDENPEAAYAKLETILGPATTVVRSGGVWNDGNGGAQDKLHLHWRLAKPARERDDLVKLKRVREICAYLVDADPTSIPICHPIRWPGSWHRKDQPRLTEIVACNPDIEIELGVALEKLEPLASTPPPTNNRSAQPGGEWGTLASNIVAGKSLHASIARLAMKMLRGGTPEVMAVQMLRGIMDTSQAPHDDRWQDRYDDIPRAVASAGRKLAAEKEAVEQEAAEKEAAAAAAVAFPGNPAQPQPQPPQPSSASQSPPQPQPPPSPPPRTGPTAPAAGPSPAVGASSSPIEDTLETFERWLILPNRTPVYAMLGTVAANLLPGDPVWLGLVAPPSSAKTELLNSISKLPFVVSVSTLTLASLLSGTPRRQRTPGATGGLLRQVSDPGLLCLKDFTSTLTMRPESKSEVLSALREIYDGKWTRYIGTDGGKPLHWTGKLGLVFGCTGAIDTQHSVSDALGNRFLLSRMEPGEGQLRWSFRHVGGKTATMRHELAESVNRLFAAPRPDPQELSENEIERFERVTELVVRLRGAVERDRYRRELDAIYGAEGPARLGLSLERLLAGLDVLGVERKTAFEVVISVALDSTPPLRRGIYRLLCQPLNPLNPPAPNASALAIWNTKQVSDAIGLPTSTVRRGLEELTSYGLANHYSAKQGAPSSWRGIVLP
jgi:hypothetical protein